DSVPATRLTQQHRRAPKGRPSFPIVETRKTDSICRGCGKQIRRGKRYCSQCSVTATRENFSVGRRSAQKPESLAKRSITQMLHTQAIQNWKLSDLPDWLTRDVYAKEVQ